MESLHIGDAWDDQLPISLDSPTGFHARLRTRQICRKWLKDRQAKGGKNPRPGRVLTDKDIDHYQKIVVVLSETIRIMAEIDEVIETHGGWPGAFLVPNEES